LIIHDFRFLFTSQLRHLSNILIHRGIAGWILVWAIHTAYFYWFFWGSRPFPIPKNCDSLSLFNLKTKFITISISRLRNLNPSTTEGYSTLCWREKSRERSIPGKLQKQMDYGVLDSPDLVLPT
jgi:hypothetical protein